MEAHNVAAEALIQVRDGRDFAPASTILKSITAEKACLTLSDLGYSLATYVLHTDFWQVVWLNRLTGNRAPNITKDWRVAEPAEWAAIREAFLTHLDQAIAIAQSRPFTHSMKSDDVAIRTLLQIAVHNAYHVGQFVLLKRAVNRMSKSKA